VKIKNAKKASEFAALLGKASVEEIAQALAVGGFSARNRAALERALKNKAPADTCAGHVPAGDDGRCDQAEAVDVTAEVTAKPKKARKAKVAKVSAVVVTEGKMSQLDAAAVVLSKAKAAMSARELVDAMTSSGMWTSPAGKTPWATLASAMDREIKTKAGASRFEKVAPGRFFGHVVEAVK
jgi:beta-xylosidase